MLSIRPNPIIGYIMMGGSAVLETELHRHLPEGLEMATTRVPFSSVTYDGLLAMTDKIPEAARILAEARPNVIGLTNFIASCIRGREIVNMIQQTVGIQAVVPALEYVSILHALGARRITLVSRLEPRLRLLEELFLNENGIEVGHVVELEVPNPTDPFAFAQFNERQTAELISRSNLSSTQAILVDIPAFRMTPEVCAILAPCGDVPVLSLTQVMLWSTFQKVGASRDGLYLSRFLAP